MQKGLITFVRVVDFVNEMVGRAASWLTLGIVLASFSVVFMRKFLNMGFIWMQDVFVWQHGVAFMVAAGYTLLYNGHVRVDVFYAEAGPRQRAWVDLLGTAVFLLPWLAVVAWVSWSYVGVSWRVLERSPQPGGLPGVFILKSALIVFTVLVALQGLALAARSLLVLLGREEFAVSGSGLGG